MIKDYSSESMYTPQTGIFFDSSADLEQLEQYAKDKGLRMGSLAVCVADGSEYLLNSSGKWCRKGGAI